MKMKKIPQWRGPVGGRRQRVVAETYRNHKKIKLYEIVKHRKKNNEEVDTGEAPDLMKGDVSGGGYLKRT